MKKVKFITMVGDTVRIDQWMLEKAEVEKRAEKFFGAKVECRAGMYGSGNIAAGWQCRDTNTRQILGYLSLSLGQFHWLEDYEYGINVFIPLCGMWAYIPHGRICYVNESIMFEDGLS